MRVNGFEDSGGENTLGERVLADMERISGDAEELTPMMAQYYELTERYPDALVLFQVGDFYEAFCEAAERVARLCEITLTKREDSTGTYPMAGIPIDNAESYIETLLDAGYRVAVADQVEDPEETTGVVERAVTRIITPGTLTEDELLTTDDNNFVAALTAGYGLALLDVSTGDFLATGADSLSVIRDEVSRFEPAEAIVGPELDAEVASEVFGPECMLTAHDETAFELEAARETLDGYFGAPERRLAGDAEVRACGALLAYAEYTRGGEDDRLGYLNHLTRYDPREYMLLDAVALRSLELFERRAVHGDEDATLIGTIDETSCALGSRRLRDWLRRPLLDRDRIEARLDAVEELTGAVRTRERLREDLADVYDIERLVSRVGRGRANARDLRSLKDTLDVLPELRDALADAESETLRDVRDRLDPVEDVRSAIGEAIREDPPPEITEGDLIKPGYDERLDELRATERDGKEWVEDLEARERERTGIDSLKVGYNSVHGYYIEVTDPNLDRVPEDYQRRQTLKNAERFYTPELKRREDEILRAERRADDLEHELFLEVRAGVAAEAERLQTVAGAVADLDALSSLAEVAATRGYTRPAVMPADGGGGLHIEGGRHPVVERTEAEFVPNDAHLDDETTVAVITGPNMSGKSTYMRQVALIQVLAQVGSFVPAADATLELVDRVYTRVGASDDIAGGRSTFMIEMEELATILRSATPDSLVLLDEVGRGTSTTDGLAIARAVTEHLHDRIGATTLFATHHHELTALADRLPRAVNLHFDARETDGEVTFDHTVRSGAATASYGIEVAGSAGVPEPVVEQARSYLEAETPSGGDPDDVSGPPDPGGNGVSPGSPEGNRDDESLYETLRGLDIARMTPLEALETLDDLRRRAERDGG